ncbi:serine/threonine-protein kinase [Plantactinospora sp. GCM10030261]|uniref:serine/threonine-protein kinase n=1 Tax=Plantactinospora sp. GCM10030261 TaxID=3273420 RepID=UPI00360ED27D
MFPKLSSEDPRVVGGYQLRARLGFGGMGQVYLSFTPGGRAVALKVVRREYADDADFRGRFAQEVRAAQRVSGRYTAQLLDAGPDAETPWLATEYVPGPTLHQAIKGHGPMPPAAVRQLIAAAATSLQAIHGADVVHRDLTPRNLLLVTDGPRIIDFGIARAVDATHLTLSHTPIGTPSFMAPEQAAGEQVTPATDVFTLGTVAYFAATGRTAFGDGNYLSVLRRVADVQADLTDCPAELRELVESCLRREPERRPTTTEIVEMCGGTPRFAPDWLSRPIRGEVTQRTKAVAELLKSHAPAAPAPAPTGSAQPGRRPGKARRTPPPAKPAGPTAPPPTRPAGPTAQQPGKPARATKPPAGPTRIVPPTSDGAKPTNPLRGWAESRHLKRVGAALALLLVGLVAGVAITIRLVDAEREADAQRDADKITDTGSGTDSPSPSPPAIASASAAPTVAPEPTVRWTGTITVTYRGMDIDQKPPVVAPEPKSDSDLQFGSYPNYSYRITGSDRPDYAKWEGQGSPTPTACRDLISTNGLSSVEIRPRDVVCVQTGEQRIAAVTITSAPKDISAGFTAKVTIWDMPEGT